MAANWQQWFRRAADPKIVRRGLKMALIVGSCLIAINHGDAILRGDLPIGRLAKMGLTLVVPFVVSTISSVGTLLEAEATLRRGAAPTQ